MPDKWRVIAGKIIYSYGPFSMAMLNNQMVCKAYVREYSRKIWPYTVQYLHFRILEFPLTIGSWENLLESAVNELTLPLWKNMTSSIEMMMIPNWMKK